VLVARRIESAIGRYNPRWRLGAKLNKLLWSPAQVEHLKLKIATHLSSPITLGFFLLLRYDRVDESGFYLFHLS
jgi:hypothetical protein